MREAPYKCMVRMRDNTKALPRRSPSRQWLHAPEHAEWTARQVRILYQRNVLCAAEGNGNVAAELFQRLRPSSPRSAISSAWLGC